MSQLKMQQIFREESKKFYKSKEDLKGYQEIINEEKYKNSKNVESLRFMNNEIF